MPGAPGSPAVAGIEAAVVAAFFLGIGYLLADAAAPRLDPVLRWALAFPALSAYTVAIMVVHIASGGRVLGVAWVARGSLVGTAAVLVALKLLRRRRSDPAGKGWRPELGALLGLTALALAVWGSPVGRLVPLDPTRGDTFFHMGLASQLLDGETTPSGTITGDIPNFYPWLFQAEVAEFAILTPGGRAYDALSPLQLVVVAGSVMALFALGREVSGRWQAGAATAVFGAMSGGFGWVLLHGLDVIDPRRGRAGRYLGDLMYKRSYNVAFSNMSPPFPRDVALVLVVASLALLAAGLSRRSRGLLVVAGVVLGMAGLAGGESFFVGLGVAAVVSLAPGPSLSRTRTAAAVLVPALLVSGIWYVPTAINYVRLGGFVNITLLGPIVLSPWAILASWGVTTPFGAYGFFRWAPRARTDSGVRVALGLLAVSAGVLLLSAVAAKGVGGAFLALSRRHRYWPLLHLGVAVFAGLGAGELLAWLAARGRRAAPALGAVVLALALPSPVLASLAAPVKFGRPTMMSESLMGRPDTLLNRIAPVPGRRCVAAVPSDLQAAVFSYTGYRLVLYRWAGYRENFARIRWRNIYDRIPGDWERLSDNTELITGSASPERWRALVAKYGVDVVVVSPGDADEPAFEGLPTESGLVGRRSYRVVWPGACAR